MGAKNRNNVKKKTYPRQAAKDRKYDKIAVFDLKKMDFVNDKTRRIEFSCDETNGIAPIVN